MQVRRCARGRFEPGKRASAKTGFERRWNEGECPVPGRKSGKTGVREGGMKIGISGDDSNIWIFIRIFAALIATYRSMNNCLGHIVLPFH